MVKGTYSDNKLLVKGTYSDNKLLVKGTYSVYAFDLNVDKSVYDTSNLNNINNTTKNLSPLLVQGTPGGNCSIYMEFSGDLPNDQLLNR